MKTLLTLLCCLGGLSACDEIIDVRNVPPEVTPLGLCAADGHTFFALAVQDYEEMPVDVDIVVDGAVIGVGAAGDGSVGLRSDRHSEGVTHLIEWGTDCSERPLGPSGITTCAAATGVVAGPIGVTVHADDGQAVVVNSVTFEALDACP